MITNEHIEQFIAQAHRVGDAGLTICSSGNISWRIGINFQGDAAYRRCQFEIGRAHV